jgi:hypothetical protein
MKILVCSLLGVFAFLLAAKAQQYDPWHAFYMYELGKYTNLGISVPQGHPLAAPDYYQRVFRAQQQQQYNNGYGYNNGQQYGSQYGQPQQQYGSNWGRGYNYQGERQPLPQQ